MRNLITVASLTLALLLPSTTAQAGTLEQAKRLHDRLAGVPADAATLSQMQTLLDAGDATAGVELARLGQNGFDGLGARVHRTAGIKQAYQHGQSFFGINDKNSRRRFGSLRKAPRMTELIILLSMSFTPRQPMQ